MMHGELWISLAMLAVVTAIVMHLGCDGDACGDFVSPLFKLALVLGAIGTLLGWVIG